MSVKKIKKITELHTISLRLKSEGKKIVFTNGCFDILHFGHVRYLESAKRKGDVLIVGVNTDASVKRIKGNSRPIIHEKDRAGVIAGLESVDYVVLFNEDTPFNTIRAIRPDILIKGADWNKDKIVGADFVSGYGGQIITVKLAKGRSTTHIINKIAKKFCAYGEKNRSKTR